MGIKDDYLKTFGSKEEEKTSNQYYDQKHDINYYLSTEKGKQQMLDKIHEIMNFIDFERIHKAMVALDWCWLSSNKPPTTEEIKEHLLNLLCELFDEKCHSISTGGFYVSYEICEPDEDEPDDFEHCVLVRAYAITNSKSFKIV